MVLLHRLSEFSVPQFIIKFIENYLKDRKIVLKMNNIESDEYTIPYGIAQGSHFFHRGPVFFIIFINSLVLCINPHSAHWVIFTHTCLFFICHLIVIYIRPRSAVTARIANICRGQIQVS